MCYVKAIFYFTVVVSLLKNLFMVHVRMDRRFRSVLCVRPGSHLKAVLLSQDARVDRFDDGVLIQSEVQRLGSAAGGQ